MPMRALRVSLLLAGLSVLAASIGADDKPPGTVRVAAVQCSSDLGDVAANRTKLTLLVREAARGGAKIIVLPEAAITGYLSQDLKTNWRVSDWPIMPAFAGKDPRGFAETVPGESTEHFAALAKEFGVYVTVPLVEVEAGPDGKPVEKDPKYYNTVCLAAPDGTIVAHYRKLTPWNYPEQSWATPGDRGVATYDTEYGRVGLAICYDIHTILDKYKGHDLWALLYPIAWVDDEHPAEWFWHKLPQRVARFNHHVVGANWSVDARQDWRGYGFSTIISSTGEVAATARSLHGSEIIYAHLPTAPAQ